MAVLQVKVVVIEANNEYHMYTAYFCHSNLYGNTNVYHMKFCGRSIPRACSIDKRLRVVEWVALIRFLFGMWHY